MDSANQEPDEISEITNSNLLELDGSVKEEPEDLNVLEYQLLEELEQKDEGIDYLPFPCEYCGARFKQKSVLQKHQNKRIGVKYLIKYKCRVGDCNISFSCKQQKYDHVELFHPPNQPQIPKCSWKCSECSFTATNSNGLRTHSLIHKPMHHRCDQCSHSFETWTLLISHKDIHHKHACSKCGFQFETRKDFREHQSQMGNFKCLFCNEEFECEYAKSQHLERDHEKDIDHRKQLATLQHKESLKLETFDVEMKFECDHCGFYFNKRRNLLLHMLDHLTFVFSCDDCGARFCSFKRLTVHRQLNSGNFKCVKENCIKVFKCKRALKIHTREDHSWKCPDCSEFFKTRNKLRAHCNKQHTKKHNTKFQCDHCELSFRKGKALKFHQWRFHQMYRNQKFTCEKCEKKFKTPNDLRKHEILTHPNPQTKKIYKSRLLSNQNPQFAFVSMDSTGSIAPKQIPEKSQTVTETLTSFVGRMEGRCSIKEEPENAFLDIESHHMVAANEQEISSEANQRLETIVQHEQEDSPLMTDTLAMNIHVEEEPDLYNLLELDGSVKEETEDLNVLEYQLLEELEQEDGSLDYLPFSCEYCGTRFEQESHLQKHQFNESVKYKAGKKHKCFVGRCKRTFFCIQLRNEHVELHHPSSQPMSQPQIVKCSECSFVAKNLHGLKSHSTIHKLMHRCDQCSHSFETWKLLISHKDSHHKHACSKCGFKFETRKDFREHQSQMGNFECLLCEEEFECEYARSQHLDKDHQKDVNQLSTLQHKEQSELDVEIQFECDHCGLSFDKRPKLINHMIDHTTKHICSCTECGLIFTSLERLNNHQKLYSGYFKCKKMIYSKQSWKQCKKVFKCQRALKIHQREDHSWKCPGCPEFFKTKNKLRAHCNKQHTKDDNTKFQCDLCELSFLKERALKFHKWKFHHMNRTERSSCDKCERKFKTLNELKKHEILAHPNPQTKNKYLSRLQRNQEPQFSFVTVDSSGSIVPKQEQEDSSTVTELWDEGYDFIHHQEISSDTSNTFDTKTSVVMFQEQEESSTENHLVKPSVKRFACRKCGQKFAERKDKKIHEKNWSKRLCEICDKEFQCKFGLSQHIWQDHENESKCRKCPFVGRDLKSLRYHCNIRHKAQALALQTSLEMPETHNKYACNICGLEFGTRKGFREHQLQMGIFKCLFCDEKFECEHARSQHHGRDHEKEFNQLAALQHKESSELETFDVEMKFECDHCGLSFDKRRNLLIHMNDHLKFPLFCDDCGAKFSRLVHLKSHRKVYSGNFKCSRKNCTKVFKCKRARTTHIRKDHEEIWKCPECPEIFKARKKLQNHHNNQHNKRFQCDLCELTFFKETLLRHHKWKFHEKDMDTSKFSCAECGKKFWTRDNLKKHKVQTDHQIFRKQSRSNKNSNKSFVDPKQIPEKSQAVTETLTSFEGHIEKLAGYSIKEEMTSEIIQGLETAVQSEQEESPLVTETLGINIHVKEEPEVSYVLKFLSEEEEL